MNNPKVSIIIPVYNGSNFVAEAIESALAQTYKNIEIIVVNDGSTDGGKTEKICKSFGNKIRYFKKKNGGVSTALNFGIEKMTGEYFSWLSHDDLYLPEKLETQINFIKNKKLNRNTIIYSDFILIDSIGNHIFNNSVKSISKGLVCELMTSSFLNGCSLLIPRSAFSIAGIFDKRLLTTQDYQLWFRFVKAGFNFAKCNGFLIKSRQHIGQDSLTLLDSHKDEKDNLYLWVFENFTPRQIFGLQKNYRLNYLNLSVALKANGYSLVARKARSIALIDCGLYRYGYLLKYNLFLPIVRIIKNIWGSGCRFIIKYAIGLASKYFFRQSRIYTDSPLVICLIGDLSSIHNLKYIDYLKSQKYEIHFLATHFYKVDGIKIYDLSRRKFENFFCWSFRLFCQTRRITKQINPHIVHGLYLIPCGILALISGFKPYIVAAWGSDILETPWIARSLVRKTLNFADLVIGTSEQLVRACLAKGSNLTKTYLVRIGIDLNIFKPRNAGNLRRKLKIGTKKVILSPRSIDYIYNNKIIVEAFSLIHDKENLVLAMIDQPYNPKYAREVRNYIDALGLQEKIIYLPAVENKKMADYYNLANLVVSFPSSDSFSVCIIESLACGKKVVMSDLLNLNENWSKNLVVWRSKIKAKTLCKIIEKALNVSEEEFMKIGRNNRRLVKKNANLKTCFNQMNDLYMQIVRK